MIKVLSKETIDKIAAGEVVERPMSIVKELLENSIDSGATSITAEIKDGGISLIRVTDNGCGINRDEVRTAFLRHATGKIEDAEDLGRIMTLGFRGEALSSIAAVCRCEIITKTAEAVTAVRYIIDGGTEQSFEDVGAPDGTTMLVRDIFYNTPARRKFLKTASTEAAHISDLVEKLALSHGDIAFRLIINGQTRLQTAGNSDLKAVIYSIYGRQIASAVLPVDMQRDGISVTGYIGKPEISRPNRNYENYFVNGRYIKSNTIAKAIEDAYEDRMMSRQFPFALLMISIDPTTIDVNVHPTKMDVRFSEPMAVYDAVKRAVRLTLQDGLVVPRQRLESNVREHARTGGGVSRGAGIEDGKSACEANVFVRHREAYTSQSGMSDGAGATDAAHDSKAATGETAASGLTYEHSTADGMAAARMTAGGTSGLYAEMLAAENSIRLGQDIKLVQNADPGKDTRLGQDSKQSLDVSLQTGSAYTAESYHSEVKRAQQMRMELKQSSDEDEQIPGYRYIGQVFDTYLIIQMDERMYIIDQHAAHEKIYYEKFLSQYKQSEVVSQMVDPPMIVTLSDVEAQAVQDNMELLASMGYEIEPFGAKEYAVRSIPAMLPSLPKDELLLELINGLVSQTDIDRAAQAILEKTATMACKAAIKANHTVDAAEADALLKALFRCDNPFNCPHGRPTMIEFTEADMEKRFRRVL